MQFVQIYKYGKRWLLSTADFRLSLCLFHPNNWKGRLFKSAFIVLHKLHCVTLLPAVNITEFELDKTVCDKIGEIYNCSSFDYSIYSNNDGITPKQTIQIVNSGAILGYCHLSVSDNVLPKLKFEQNILTYLNGKSVENIPLPQYLGRVNSNNIFCQSTKMTKGSRFSNTWNDKHSEFLIQLFSKTEFTLQFEKTDFYHLLLQFQDASSRIKNKNYVNVLKDGVDNILSVYQGKKVQFCVSHWDFTPWNMFLENGTLFVIDWEYAYKSFPPYIDYFHFLTQNCILVKRMTDPRVIYFYYLKEKKESGAFIPNSDFIYICYLVGIIIFYYIKHPKFSEKDRSCQCWFGLLNLLIPKL